MFLIINVVKILKVKIMKPVFFILIGAFFSLNASAQFNEKKVYDSTVHTGLLGGQTPAAGWIGVVMPYNSVDINASSPGLLKLLVRPGDMMPEGSVIATIQNDNAEEELNIAQLKLTALTADLEQAEFNAAQENAIYQRRITFPDAVSKDELNRSESIARAAEAEEKAARASLEEQRIRVEQARKAMNSQSVIVPFTGVVDTIYLDSGSIVSSGKPILRLSASNLLMIRFAVDPSEAESLTIGDRVVAAIDTVDVQAEVMSIARMIDIPSQKVFVEAYPLEDSPLLRPGLGVYVNGQKAVGQLASSEP